MSFQVQSDQNATESQAESEKTAEGESGEQKGEKRKREGDSPEREGAQKIRAKSPVKEDEPEIHNENVQLNWCK